MRLSRRAVVLLVCVLVVLLRGVIAVVGPEVECPAAVALPPAVHSTPRSSLTVATFNVEWLFDGVGDAHSPRNDPFDAQVRLHDQMMVNTTVHAHAHLRMALVRGES